MSQHAEGLDALCPTPRPGNMTDNRAEILRFAADALTGGLAAALVTLVEIRGGAARPLGTQMAVREDGVYCGFVSGGCVESAAAHEAMQAIAAGEDRTVRYGQGSPWFDIVLPCGGGIALHIHCLRAVHPLLAVLNALEQRRAAGLRFHPRTQTLTSSTEISQTGWTHDAFDVAYRPQARALIFGRSIEAQMTASIAQAAGYDVLTREGFAPDLTRLIDADTAVILLYHDLHKELPVLQAALAAAPFYLGALGSRRTHDARVTRLAELGWGEQDLARIKAPIGLFAKARDAQSLALSVIADVAAARQNSLWPENNA
nr:XdhC family protein [uncultured Enterobacter sp.]